MFHINLYDLVLLGTIFVGLIFTLLLWFTNRIIQAAKPHRMLVVFGLFWLLWIPLKVADCFYYHYQLGIYVYYPLYFILATVIIWIAAAVSSKPGAIQDKKPVPVSPVSNPSTELIQKGIWLQKAMEMGRFYQQAELNLRSLAETLDVHPNELSRIINLALGKNFNDFINEYRIKAVICKM
jgi:AraC-like DNA-binding protein